MLAVNFLEFQEQFEDPNYYVWGDVPLWIGISLFGLLGVALICGIVVIITLFRKHRERTVASWFYSTIIALLCAGGFAITAVNIASYDTRDFHDDLDAAIATQLIKKYDAYGHEILVEGDDTIDIWFQKATDQILEPAYIEVEVSDQETYTYEIVIAEDTIELFTKPGEEEAPLPDDLLSPGMRSKAIAPEQRDSMTTIS